MIWDNYSLHNFFFSCFVLYLTEFNKTEKCFINCGLVGDLKTMNHFESLYIFSDGIADGDITEILFERCVRSLLLISYTFTNCATVGQKYF